ncbi:MAG TPA: hypothetical protein VKV80_14895 [Streptosporangiaceae bacterium]|nr:hypothetical protein [Streptosporangiaceae bacterium]
MVLAVVGDPDEPPHGRREQQRPDGSADGRVRDIEQAFAAGRSLERPDCPRFG